MKRKMDVHKLNTAYYQPSPHLLHKDNILNVQTPNE